MRSIILVFLVLIIMPTATMAEKFTVNGEELNYDEGSESGIVWEDVEKLKAILLENPKISKLNLTSKGGELYAARELADLVIDFELDTHVIDVCSSACVLVFLGGTKRTMQRGSKLGFHQSSWDSVNIEAFYNDYKTEYEWGNVFDFASWIVDDTQKDLLIDFEYYLERNVSGKFAIKTLQASNDEMWYPRRKELLNAGVIVD